MNRVKSVRIISALGILVAVGLIALLSFFVIRSQNPAGSPEPGAASQSVAERSSLQDDETGTRPATESDEVAATNSSEEILKADNAETVNNDTSGDVSTGDDENGRGTTPLPAPEKAIASAEDVGDVLQDPEVDWTDPKQRALAVARMKEAEESELAAAIAKAKELGLPLREELPEGGLREVAGLDDDGEVVYFETKNVNAAISTGANLLQTSPYSLDGAGIMVGVWDGGSVLSTHQEFNEGSESRVSIRDGAASNYHATHVGGTVGAFGVVPNAKGMAPQSLIESYDWFSDTSEMTAAAAFGLGQLDSKVHLSNHSYGYSYGWRNSGGVWTWTGTGTDQNAYDADFGQYSSMSRNLDSLVYNSPYYVIFWSAGNESNDGPGNGQTCTIGGASVTYDRSIHPQNDGDYSGGFDTIGDHGVAKNLITVGAANDAVSGGQRDPSRSTIASFSSVGPTDDGRIKPDLVANGVGLYSSDNGNDTDYRSLSGTSMSAPNTTGSAALLVDLYRDLFDGNAMRGSTLRGLLIHTATDIGNPGPDYTYGWGLVDAKEAADHIQRQADFPGLNGMIEGQLSDSQTSENYSFSWDGVSPIRATLCWNDPAGTAENAHNDRSPDLVNNLNLKLTAPDGTTHHFPFVMPFVGSWTEASMSQSATTGVNNTDNVEQVLVASPQQAGNWQAEVSYDGGLTNGAQDFSLLISGIGAVGSLSFDAESYTVDEDAGVATISVNRLAGNAGAVSVSYATQDDTALAGSDYTATSGTLTWSDGEDGARTIEVPIINDGLSEAYEETFLVTLSNPGGGIAISGAVTANLTIVDDEPFFGVTAPNGDEVLPVNSPFNITWVSSLGGSVRIDLLRGGLLVQTLAASTANDGLFEWIVPASLPNGGGYSVRISHLGGGGQSDTSNDSFTVENLVEVDLYAPDMSSDPGWTLQGNWAYGTPTGGGGQYGNADPTSGNTGGQVIGYNLSGDYENNLGETYATTPAIDCSGISNVELSFYRWLNVETNQYDNAGIRVSNDGINWTEIWSNSGQVTDSSWSQQTFDISAVADGEATVYIRWVMGATDGSWQFSGWNIDDVVVSGLGEGSAGPNNPPVVDAGADQTVMLQSGTPVAGLYYGTVPGNINITTPNPNTQILLDVGSQTENSIASNTTEVYTGSIYDADGQISFTEHIDDKVRIWIDDMLVLSNDAWNTRTSTANLNLAPGWHTVEIRISNGTGGSGPPSGVGIGYDPTGGTAWQTLVDPGDGSFLRASQELPEAVADLDGTVSDLDLDPLTTSWSVVSGPGSVNFDELSVVDTSARFDAAGTYTLRLTADDGKDVTSDEVTITVESMLVTVPNLVGLNQSAAESALIAAGFTVGTVSTAYSDAVAAGNVISQVISPGTQLPEGSGVDFTVSLGAQMVSVPNVVGSSQAAAESNISGANLTVGTVTGAYSSTVPAGDVISQNPGGGSSVVVGSSVDLVVSLGVQLITVPDVTGLAQASAESALTGAGLTVGAITTSYDDTVPAGTVISQGTAAGSSVAVGTAIALVVSDGPEPNTPPVVDAGENQTVTLAGASWSPDSLTPSLWLDASDAASISLNGSGVSQWNDKSGNDRHATQGAGGNQPTLSSDGLNGMDVLTFDGSTDFLNVDLDFMAGVDHSVFVVTKTTAHSNIYGAANRASGSNSLHVGFRNSTSYRMNYWGNDWYGTISSNNQPNSANLLNFVWQTGVSKEIFANGVSEGTTSNAGLIGTMAGGGRISNVTGHGFYGGDIAEFIAFDRALTLAERQELEGYLAHKWGTEDLLVTAHPHKTDGPDGVSAQASLDATVTDEDGDPISYSWTVVSGPGSVEFSDASSEDGNATFTVEGTYVLRLTVEDGTDSSFDEVTITVDQALLTVPDLVGLSQSAAESDLTDAGFVVGTVGTDYSDTVAAGNVISQGTPAGSALAGGSAVDFVVSLGPETATVPNVVGLSQSSAEASIAAAQLAVGSIATEYNDTVAAGDVISQGLGAGSEVPINSIVDLVVSLGPETVIVPNVVGLNQSSAEASITAAQLVVGSITTEYSAVVPAGDVISQGLGAGSSVPVNSAVDLVVSLGVDLSPKLIRTTVNGVSSASWTTVNLGRTYNSPVIIATPIYPDRNRPAVVTRITNITATGFDLKIDRTDGQTEPVNIDVSIIAVDEGVYTQAEHGVTMEAVKYTSTVTARKNGWVAESRSFQNSYTNPIVVGQVMSANDPNWSVFWSMGSSRTNPVNASNLNVGKHVGEDPNTTRSDETIGYIVIESGTGAIEGVAYEAGIGGDIVRGIDNSANPYSYSLSGNLSGASAAAVSIGGMDGVDGAWAVLGGTPAFSPTGIGCWVDEDTLRDTERAHTTEQIGFLILE